MPRDYWNTLRQVLKVGKRKKSLTLAAGEYDCGPVRGSYDHRGAVDALGHLTMDLALSTTTLTVDVWLKPLANLVSPTDFFRMENSTANLIRIGYSLAIYVDGFYLQIIDSGGTRTVKLPLLWNSWNRYTVAFSSTLGFAYIYINGVLYASTVVAAFGNANFDMFIGNSHAVSHYVGYVGEIALYSAYKNDLAVSQLGSFKANIGAYGTGLVAYWPLREDYTPLVGAYTLTQGTNTFSTTEYPPIKFGASFVAAQYDVDLGKTVSLKFPNTPPTGTTGELIVRWTDADDVVQRRKLWRVTGVDVEAEDYKGEPILAPFVLELWNIDGQETAEIPEDMILYVSDTTNPTTSSDTTSQSAATVTADSTLAAPFPITFPLTFNTQQTY